MGVARRKANYHFREWIFARQRYWGEPVPIVYLEDGQIHVLDDDELPLIYQNLKITRVRMDRLLLKMRQNGSSMNIMDLRVREKLQLCRVQQVQAGII